MRGWVLGFLIVAAAVAATIFVGSQQASPKTAAVACTAETPCRIHIKFGYTMRGRDGFRPRTAADEAALTSCTRTGRDARLCLLDRVAAENTAALRLAFQRSGLSGTPERPSILFDYSVARHASDAYSSASTDVYGRPMSGSLFNHRLLSEIADSIAVRFGRAQIMVVFTGLTDPFGGCVANSAQRDGLIVMPACLTNSYATDPKRAEVEQLMFLHEIGHTFGAAHNDYGSPQPCRPGAGALAPPACAWEQRLDPGPSTRDALRFEPRAFCTLVGQYNYGSADTFCRAHRGGENGGGWIREFSHPGKCRTPGWERYDCGDATHDAVSVMRPRVFGVSTRTAGH